MHRPLCSLALVLTLAGGCRNDPIPPPVARKREVGGEFPVDKDRLTNAWLIGGIGGDKSHEWLFHETNFVVDGGKDPLPKDLTDVLLGVGIAGTRIEGKWRFDDAKSELVLTEIKSDGKAGVERATLPIAPAGMLRANLGRSQYNVRRLSERP